MSQGDLRLLGQPLLLRRDKPFVLPLKLCYFLFKSATVLVSLIFASECLLWRLVLPATDPDDFPLRTSASFGIGCHPFVFKVSPLQTIGPQPNCIDAHDAIPTNVFSFNFSQTTMIRRTNPRESSGLDYMAPQRGKQA